MKFSQFKIKFSNTRKQLDRTKIVSATDVMLPIDSTIHTFSDAEEIFGTRRSHLLVANYPEDYDVRLFHELENYGTEGSPKWKMPGLKKKRDRFFLSQRGIKKFINFDKMMIGRNPLTIIDYTAQVFGYTYRESVWSNYYRYSNLITNYLFNIQRTEERKVQFIPVWIPNAINTSERFKSLEDNLSKSDLIYWSSEGALWMRELYLLIAGKGKFASVEKPENLYFVLMLSGQAAFVSMADLQPEEGERIETRQFEFLKLVRKMITNQTASDIDEESLEIADNATEEEIVALKQSKAPVDTDEPIINGVAHRMSDMVDNGRLTSGEFVALTAKIEKIKDVPLPGETKTLGEITAQPEVVPITNTVTVPMDIPVLTDKLIGSTSLDRKRQYHDGGMEADLYRVVSSFSNMGWIVTKIEKSEVIEATNDYTMYKFTMTGVDGKATIVPLKIPNFDEFGRFKADGVKYTMDGQRGDVPLRKIKANESAITTYPGKFFVKRTARKAHDYGEWLRKVIATTAVDSDDKRVTSVVRGSNRSPQVDLPRDYTALLPRLTSFKSRGKFFYFDYMSREEMFTKEKVAQLEKKGNVLMGSSGDKFLVMDMKGLIYETTDGKALEPLGKLLSVLGGEWGTPPRDLAVAKVGGGEMPIVAVLGMMLGLRKMITILKAKVTSVNVGVTVTIPEDHILVKLKDESLLIDVSDPVHAMIFEGFARKPKALLAYTRKAMDRPQSYMGLGMAGARTTGSTLRNLEHIRDAFVDPISASVLRELGEPERMPELIVRAVELIILDNAPDETAAPYQMERGMERVIGLYYKIMYKHTRAHQANPQRANMKLAAGPEDLWRLLVADPTTQMVQDSNPMHAIKDNEAVTLGGDGGRSGNTVTKSTKAFHPTDLGVASESTPDSMRVGTRYQKPAKGKIANSRGLMGQYEEEDGPAAAFSTIFMTMPCMQHEDGNRANMSSIQRSSWVSSVGSTLLPLRTGTEAIIASQTPNEWAFSAPMDGEITKVKDDLIAWKYSDGTKGGQPLGIFHGKMSGATLPHNRITDLVKGDKFKEGDILCWVHEYFMRDPMMNPRNVSIKLGRTHTVALVEDPLAEEDSCMISSSLSKSLSTPTSTIATLTIDQNQIIRDMVKVGDQVDYNTPLGTIIEAEISDSLNDKVALEALSRLSDTSPTAEYGGKITSIEVHYMGDPKTFTPETQEIIEQDTKRRTRLRNELGMRAAKTGEITRSTFINGSKVIDGTVVISIYIDSYLDCETSDKLTVSNQLKAVPGGFIPGEATTESGRKVDLIMGGDAVLARIVGAPLIAGTMNAGLKQSSKNILAIWKE